MSKQEHPYAQVLRWIADGEAVINRHGQDLDPMWIFRAMANNEPFDAPATFRLKPRTISINGHEVPEPMRRAPAIGSTFFLALISQHIWAGEHAWQDSHSNLKWLARGLCHATREAAEAHAKALLSFTTTEQS